MKISQARLAGDARDLCSRERLVRCGVSFDAALGRFFVLVRKSTTYTGMISKRVYNRPHSQ